MATALKFYSDATLTTVLTTKTINQLADGSSPNADMVVYLGSTNASATYQANSNPSVDQIVLSIADSAPSSGIEVTNIKLATSLLGLDVAVAGDPLSLGTEILGGVANLVEVYIRSDTPVLATTNTDITINTNEIIELV